MFKLSIFVALFFKWIYASLIWIHVTFVVFLDIDLYNLYLLGILF